MQTRCPGPRVVDSRSGPRGGDAGPAGGPALLLKLVSLLAVVTALVMTNGPAARASALVPNAAIPAAMSTAAPGPGSIETWAGGGPPDGATATQTGLVPTGVVPASGGGFFLSSGSVVYKVSTAGSLTRVAGTTDVHGFAGDGGPATSALLSYPGRLAVDAAGNLYIADINNYRVRKLTPGGTISTVAGNGSPGSAGDGGPATTAQLSFPGGLAVDAAGNLYIADSDNNRIRQVTPGGTISTVAGTGTSGFSGDGGPATAAALSYPDGVAVDVSGNVYIGDSSNSRIRKVAAATGTISTVAGNGTSGFSGDGGPATSATLSFPGDLGVDGSGNLYLADPDNNRVRKVTAATGTISTVAGNGNGGFSGDGGPATSAELGYPGSLGVDGAGTLLIADVFNGRVRKVIGGTISTVAGNGTNHFSGDNGPATSAQLAIAGLSGDVTPLRGMAVDGTGNVYLADAYNSRVRKVTPAGTISTVAGTGTPGYSGDGGPATSARLETPTGLAVDNAGNLYIADTYNFRVRKVSTAGTITTIAGTGTPGASGDGGPATAARLNHPAGLAVDSIGTLYVADGGNGRIRKISTAGTISTIAGTGTAGFSGDGGPAITAQLDGAYDVAVDGVGTVYIADAGNARIRKVTTAGTISTIAGNGISGFAGDGGPAVAAQLSYPTGLAVDSGGDLYVADVFNDRVRKVTAGTINTVAGNGTGGFSGDGGAAASARLNSPSGLTLDAGGSLYIADSENSRVRIVGGGPAAAGSTYTAITPARVLDSRDGTGGYPTAWPANTARPLSVTGANGVPANATAVVLNVTATSPTAPGYLTIYPTGATRPVASNLNFTPGQTIPNLVVTGISTTGQVSFYNSAGTTHVIADIVGYYAPTGGSTYTAITPARVLDSRDGTGGYPTAWPANTARPLSVTGANGVPANATAVVLNVTATSPTAPGYLTIYPTGATRPVASNLNFTPGQTIPNLVVTGISTTGQVSFYNSAGTTHVIADIVGYYAPTGGSTYTAITPARVLDSRDGTGGYPTAWPANTARPLSVTGANGVPANATAVVLNVTATSPTAPGYLTIYPTGATRPVASNLNFTPGQTIPNLVVTGISTTGQVSFYNSAGTTHVIADIVGYYR